jgi:hypothetical protein
MSSMTPMRRMCAMRPMRVLTALAALFVTIGFAGTAAASCPDRRASCVLHEEGVALFLDNKFEAAAAKFAAAIAAEPTARSYLGYAQAVESLGQIALAYDTMVAAQRLSTTEVQATGGKDVEVNARVERIKYKLGELRAKIGFVWLRVPEGVPPQRVVSVQRQGEGDLYQPLTQWTAVAPGKQVLVASIDDGSKIEVVANVAAGTQGVVVIPIPARGRQNIGPGPGPGPGPNVVPVPNTGTGRPLASLYQPVVRPPPPVYKTYFALGASVLAPGPGQASSGSGLTALYERRIGSSLGIATRLEYELHGENTDFTGVRTQTISASEVVALFGIRTMSSNTLHGRAGVGFTVYSQDIHDEITGGAIDSFTRIYPAFELGGGAHLGRLRLQMSILFTTAAGGEVDLGTRFMGTLGIDLYRK